MTSAVEENISGWLQVVESQEKFKDATNEMAINSSTIKQIELEISHLNQKLLYFTDKFNNSAKKQKFSQEKITKAQLTYEKLMIVEILVKLRDELVNIVGIKDEFDKMNMSQLKRIEELNTCGEAVMSRYKELINISQYEFMDRVRFIVECKLFVKIDIPHDDGDTNKWILTMKEIVGQINKIFEEKINALEAKIEENALKFSSL